jgi:hypothetical protein
VERGSEHLGVGAGAGEVLASPLFSSAVMKGALANIAHETAMTNVRLIPFPRNLGICDSFELRTRRRHNRLAIEASDSTLSDLDGFAFFLDRTCKILNSGKLLAGDMVSCSQNIGNR